jgi:purine nucleosidase
MIRKIMEDPGEVTLITLGALTNVASALLREPKVAANVKEVYSMGGAVLAPGNTTPVAEFNIWGDPPRCEDILQRWDAHHHGWA